MWDLLKDFSNKLLVCAYTGYFVCLWNYPNNVYIKNYISL